LKTLVAVLGFEESIVISAAIRHKLELGDRLIIITSKDQEDSRAEAARRRLQGFVQQAGVDRPWLTLTAMPVSEHDIEGTILVLVSLLHAETGSGRKVIVEVSGGLRVLCLALFLAASIVNSMVEGIYTVTENTRELLKLPRLDFRPRLSSVLKELIDTVAESEETLLEDLANSLGKDLSTISRQVRRLEEMGLVTREGLHPTRLKPTVLGKALHILSSKK